MTQNPIRFYVVLKAGQARQDVNAGYFGKDARQWAAQFVTQHLLGSSPSDPPLIKIRALPSEEVLSPSERPEMRDELDELVVALDAFGDVKRSADDVVDHIVRVVAQKQDIFAGASPDLPFASADHWCIGDAADPIFSDRSAAERLHGIDFLRRQVGTTGRGVNVVIVDQGLDRHELGASYAGGWRVGHALPGDPVPQPGSVRRSHGMMIAHNILKVAPEAKLFDMPLVPSKISQIQAFLSYADAAFFRMRRDIGRWRPEFPGPWIAVNPWGIFDRRSEQPLGHYTERPSHFSHLVESVIAHNIDVIFAAGNCGQFCPDDRCGERDRGPSRSIWGANSLAAVLTTGAVRADGMWLGYSSQGPGQPDLGTNKPDLCAASQFCEDGDAFSINTGSSASCGLTAGVVAALRSRWKPATVSPQQLKLVLNNSARKPAGLNWGNSLGHRLGNGVLNAKRAFEELNAQFP
jgi:subtilisin family serine protease